MDKLNILFINRWVGYNEGGTETHIKDFLQKFSEHGHDVHIITTEGDKLDFLKEKVTTYYIKGPKEYFSNKTGGLVYASMFLLKSFLVFLKLSKKQKIDIISVRFNLEAYLCRFIKLFFGIPYITVLAGDTYFEIIEGKRADGAVHTSNYMNRQSKKYGYSAKVLPKGIDLKRFKPKNKSVNLKDKNILSVCRLTPKKNLVTLIEAANILVNKKKHLNYKFIIVGDGVQRQFLEQKVKEYKLEKNILFTGPVDNKGPELPKYYTSSDLFVLPTLYEGFGWVFLEAMASGCPIITTGRGSNPEVVGNVGIIIEAKNPVLLADKIENVLTNEDLRTKLIKKGLEKSKKYNWDIIYPKFENYYFQISKKKITLSERFATLYFIITDTIRMFVEYIKMKIENNDENWEPEGQLGL